MSDTLFLALGVLVAVGGLALLFLALFRDRAKGRRRCPKCWYDMSGIPSLQCPECGKTAAAENKLFKTRRRWRWVALACMLVIAGGATVATPKFERDGPFAFVPTPLLNWIASHFDEQAEALYARVLTPNVGGPATSNRLNAWERVLAARAAEIRAQRVREINPGGSSFRYVVDWLHVVSLAENETRLLAPTLKQWITEDIERGSFSKRDSLGMDPVRVSGWIAKDSRPLPGLAKVLERYVEYALKEGGQYSSFGLCSLAVNDPTGVRTIPLAIRVLDKHESPAWRSEAVRALGIFIGRDERALDAIVDAAGDRGARLPLEYLDPLNGTPKSQWKQARVCDTALRLLLSAGPDAAPAIPRLEQLAIEHPDLRDQIEQTINAIRSDMESGN